MIIPLNFVVLPSILSGICYASLAVKSEKAFAIHGAAVLSVWSHLRVMAPERNKISTVPATWSREGRALRSSMCSLTLLLVAGVVYKLC